MDRFDLPTFSLPLAALRFTLPPLEWLVDLVPLTELRARLDERLHEEPGGETARRRLEEFRQRLRTMPFEDAAAIDNSERLLLSLYLLDTGKADAGDYLPEFDEATCEQILGAPGTLAVALRLRQAAQLFFTHFDRLPGQIALGRLIQRSLASAEGARFTEANLKAWRQNLAWLFGASGPERLMAHRRPTETLRATAERYRIPTRSRFLEVARQGYFQLLRTMPLGQDIPIFDEIIEQRNTILSGGRLLGMAALEILISRSLSENEGRLPDAWGARIAALSCDPRLPRQSSEFNRWWSWADDKSLAVALSWFTGRDLEAFLLLLEKSLQGEAARMVPRRAAFLRGIYRSNKMIRTRLGLIEPTATDGAASGIRSSDGISLICVQCDGFSFVDGTHNFAIQVHDKFPIEGFWQGADLAVDGEREAIRYEVADFRKNRVASIPHTDSAMMKWEHKFLNALQSAPFYLRWTGIGF